MVYDATLSHAAPATFASSTRTVTEYAVNVFRASFKPAEKKIIDDMATDGAANSVSEKRDQNFQVQSSSASRGRGLNRGKKN